MPVVIIIAIVFLVLWLLEKKNHKKDNEARQAQIDFLAPYREIVDVQAEVQNLRDTAQNEIRAEREAAKVSIQIEKDETQRQRLKARAALEDAQSKALEQMQQAKASAESIIKEAKANAQTIAGDALEAKGRADEWEKRATAMRNIVEGYGDEYLKPTFSLLDELAEDFGHTEAGQKLKEARAHSAMMVKAGAAATCDYVETNRRTTAIAFVVDAFNGKVDSILSKTKKDNHGVLEQRIKDAYALVNGNGEAFRSARVQAAFLQARLDELKWACIVSELKAREQEEQRRLREQMREEEKARREYERAMRDAEKEEAMLQKAMEKARQQLEAAKEENRAEYEAKLLELEGKLREAHEKNQRALSMAQQTKRGNVYIISNLGSFGENVYKVGMTRRLEPLDRIRELGDASVPFAFDVHAMIESEDAPALESGLHRALALTQMNKVNPRKEFFRVALADIRALVEKQGLDATWTLAAEAAEYRETLAIEESMKNDPSMVAKWRAFAESVAAEAVAEAEESA